MDLDSLLLRPDNPDLIIFLELYEELGLYWATRKGIKAYDRFKKGKIHPLGRISMASPRFLDL